MCRFLIVLSLLCWSASALAEPVRVGFRVTGAAAVARPAHLSWIGSQPDLPSGTREVSVPGETTLDLARGAWTLRLEVEGFWARDEVITIGLAGQDHLEMTLFPAATLLGKLDLPHGEPAPPSALSVRFRPAPVPPSSEKPPEGSATCPVVGNAWKCQVPAGLLDLRFKPGSFAPVYLWGVAVQASRVKEVGVLRLRPGASVVGWVATEPDLLPAAASRVELAPEPAGQPTDVLSQARLEALSLHALTNDRGFFQVDAVPPGRYLLTVTGPGFSPARLAPVEVRTGLETEVIERIVLRKAVRFEALLDPPTDPYGQPWRLALSARPPSAGRREGIASREGRWFQDEIAPGIYDLTVLGDLGSRWVHQEVEVESGRSPLLLQVPLVEVHGRVSRGDAPLVCTLWFGGASGARRVRFDTDDGEFQGFLPEEGIWKVELLEEEEGVRVGLEPVEVRKAPKARRAEVEIVIPDTALAGEVVDEDGGRVPGALLQVDSLEGKERQKSSRFETDAEGRFRVRGLAPGPVGVEAEAGERTSGWVPFTIRDEGESPWLKLVVRRSQKLSGRILSAGGPVPGARIEGFPDFGSVAVSSGVEATSDPAGWFSLALPPESQALHLRVMAPGFAYRLLRAPVERERPLDIQLDAQGGTLILERSKARPAPLLFHGGTFVPLQLLREWVRFQGAPWTEEGPLVVSGMEAGEYALCAGAEVIEAVQQGGPPPATQCTRGILSAYGELLLKLPPS